MITPTSHFLLGPLQHYGPIAPSAELFVDAVHIDYLYRLPYVARVGQLLDFKSKYIISFDPRYDTKEAWDDLRDELTELTTPVELGFLWEQGWTLSESEDDDDDC